MIISECVARAAVVESAPPYWETIRHGKCSPDSFDKCLRLLAVCVIKRNGILWKPFLWCRTHLSKTLDVYEGKSDFDSADISLNHTAGERYSSCPPPPKAIEEVSLLIHPVCNKLTVQHCQNVTWPAVCFDKRIVYCFVCIWSNFSKRSRKIFSRLCISYFDSVDMM